VGLFDHDIHGDYYAVMVTTHLLYLHGFRSSPRSTKAQQMAAHVRSSHPQIQWLCPALSASPRQALASLEAACRDWPKSTTVIMGSSLGGFYATALAERWGARAVLLNPAVRPQAHGAQLVGVFPQWHDPGQTLEFLPAYLDELQAMEPAQLSHPQRWLTIVATGDEVLDARELIDYYRRTQLHVHDGGDHALSDFASFLPTIDRFLQGD
jgi:uncharacterized protein